MNNSISINKKDNLGVALKTLQKGTKFSINNLEGELKESIQEKHKFALDDINIGDKLIMYGIIVGQAISDIRKGERISTKNTTNSTAAYKSNINTNYVWESPNIDRFSDLTFNGYHRSDGQIGTENNWIVFPLVFCENRNIITIKNAFEKALGYNENDIYEEYVKNLIIAHSNDAPLDDVKINTNKFSPQNKIFNNVKIKFITHQAGCGGTREDSDTLCRLLAGYLKNPNVAGATVLSLGCQNAQKEILLESIDKIGGIGNKPLLVFDQQEIGKESILIKKAIKETFNGLIEANKIIRKESKISDLTIGLECGASDGFSGISANPVLGHLSDLIVALGGKVILSEFPELGGIEQEIIDRTPSKNNVRKFVRLMEDYSRAAERVGSSFDMNPSPGNIKDGLITDAMKSAGAAKKGGSSLVNDILDYTEYIKKDGLSLLCTPGNDVESTTGLVGSGANIVLFTTGLGTPTGNPIVPVVKISSNSTLSDKMSDIIDFNAGEIIDGHKTIDELAEDLLGLIVKITSGELQTKAAIMKQDDFIPWKRGISL